MQPPTYFQAIVDKLREDPQIIISKVYEYPHGHTIDIKTTHGKWVADLYTKTHNQIVLFTFGDHTAHYLNRTTHHCFDICDPTFLDRLYNLIDATATTLLQCTRR